MALGFLKPSAQAFTTARSLGDRLRSTQWRQVHRLARAQKSQQPWILALAYLEPWDDRLRSKSWSILGNINLDVVTVLRGGGGGACARLQVIFIRSWEPEYIQVRILRIRSFVTRCTTNSHSLKKMTTPTVPTVPFPTETDTDTDDDDDDDISSIVPGQPTATTVPGQPLPPPPVSSVPEAIPTSTTPGTSPSSILNEPGPSGSTTPLADNLSTSTSPANPATNNAQGLSVGAKAGLGVGVAVAVILMAVGAWMFVRLRRRRQQRKRRTSHGSKSPNDSRDEEKARATEHSDVRAYLAPAVPELSGGGPLATNGTAKDRSELASPVVAQEVHGDREFAAELQGSNVASTIARKEDETWSPNAPSHLAQQAESQPEKKSGARLFDDAPIDDDDDDVDVVDRPRTLDVKGGV